MATVNSDKAWNAYGKKDPYYGVLTHDEFRDDNLNDEALARFFATGEKHVDSLFDEINRHLAKNFRPQTTLDFGCGTGRLSIPLAKKSQRLIGLDVSADMLREARKNAERQGVNNVEFKISDDSLSALKGERFDLINSYIVLQHINVERGMLIIEKMLQLLNSGGIGALQITYSSNKLKSNKIATYLRYRIPLVHGLLNMLKGFPYSKPLMQMNLYDMNAVLHLMQANAIADSKISFEDHGDFWSAHLIFKKA